MTWIVIYTNSFVLQIYQHQQISVKKISTTTPTTTKLHKLICVTNISTATNLQKQILLKIYQQQQHQQQKLHTQDLL